MEIESYFRKGNEEENKKPKVEDKITLPDSEFGKLLIKTFDWPTNRPDLTVWIITRIHAMWKDFQENPITNNNPLHCYDFNNTSEMICSFDYDESRGELITSRRVDEINQSIRPIHRDFMWKNFEILGNCCVNNQLLRKYIFSELPHQTLQELTDTMLKGADLYHYYAELMLAKILLQNTLLYPMERLPIRYGTIALTYWIVNSKMHRFHKESFKTNEGRKYLLDQVIKQMTKISEQSIYQQDLLNLESIVMQPTTMTLSSLM